MEIAATRQAEKTQDDDEEEAMNGGNSGSAPLPSKGIPVDEDDEQEEEIED